MARQCDSCRKSCTCGSPVSFKNVPKILRLSNAQHSTVCTCCCRVVGFMWLKNNAVRLRLPSHFCSEVNLFCETIRLLLSPVDRLQVCMTMTPSTIQLERSPLGFIMAYCKLHSHMLIRLIDFTWMFVELASQT